jgi:hypothetical protein
MGKPDAFAAEPGLKRYGRKTRANAAAINIPKTPQRALRDEGCSQLEYKCTLARPEGKRAHFPPEGQRNPVSK